MMNEEEKIKDFITQNKFWIKVGAVALAVLLVFAGGFFVGRAYTVKNTKPKVVIKYEKGDTIRDTVSIPVPYEVIQPVDTGNFIAGIVAAGLYTEVFPHRTDTVTVYVPMKEDSVAVIRDYELKRIYNETFFNNDTIGKFEFHGEVQYNRLRYYGYTFTPVHKTVTETQYIVKKFSPFIGAGLNTTPSVIAQGGVFFEEKYGFAAQYSYDWVNKKNSYGAVFMYKF